MASSRELISSTTLTGSQATVTFSSIPSTYTDLVLKISVRSTKTTSDWMQVYFNNSSSTSAYSETWLRGTGSAASSSRQSASNYFGGNGNDLLINISTDTANTFTNGEIYVPSYTVSVNKPVNFLLAAENNATAANMTALAGYWNNTSAINQIDLVASSFATGSSFYLYGIKNS